MALVWQVSRKWTVAWLVLLLMQGLLPVAIVYLTRALDEKVKERTAG